MFNELTMYLSAAEISCYDGDEGGSPDAAAAAAATKAADAAADAAAAASVPKTFDQEAVNKIVEERLSRDRQKRETENKAKYQDLQTKHETLLANKNLSDEERTKLEGSLDDVRNQLRTKEERAKHEKDQLEASYKDQLKSAETDRDSWKSLFHDSNIARDLQDAAVSNDAWNAKQITNLLQPMTSLKPNVDEDGNDLGGFRTIVDFPDHDEQGKEVTFSGTPDEIVKRMKEIGGVHANLFKSNVVSGAGAGNATGGATPGANGQVDVRNLTTQQYAKIRAEHPEQLGL